MALDLSIYNALLQPGPSAREVSNALADRRMREQDQATQRQLNALQLQKTQFDMEGALQTRNEENALRTYLGGNPDLSTTEGQMGLYKVAPKAAGGILKERATAAAQDATRLNQQRETQIKTLQYLGQVAGGVTDQASYDAALATIKQAGIDPVAIGAPPQYNPQVVANFGRQALTQAQRLEQEWKAKAHELDVSKFGESVRHNKSTEGLTLRGQNMADARARDGMAQTERHFQTTQAGKANPSRVADAQDVLGLLDMADPLIKQATSSGIGSVVDAAGSLVGASSQGADAAAQLKAIEGMLISKMPKMSGPQSDKDVLLYKQMAGRIGDSTVPVSQKQAAAKTIRDINSRYAGAASGVSVVRTGKDASGRKVEQLSDGTIRYAD